MANPVLSELPPFTLLDEPGLSFSPSDTTQVDVHPLRGLLNFGRIRKDRLADTLLAFELRRLARRALFIVVAI